MNEQTVRTILRDDWGTDMAPAEAAYLDQYARRYADLVKLLPSAPIGGARLIDVGIFPGHLAALAQSAGYAIDGISNEEMTEVFRTRAERVGFRITEADVEEEALPFPDDHFEVVLFCEILEHLYRDPFKPFSEIYRVLKPGGSLILSTPNLASWDKIRVLLRGRSYRAAIEGPLDESFPLNRNYTHVREYTMHEVRHLLCEQDKRAYCFRPARFMHSRCWNQTLAQALIGSVNPFRMIKGLVGWTLQTILPGSRSSLMVRVTKPVLSVEVSPVDWESVSGFHDVEEDVGPGDRSRRALPAPFRWSTARAGFSFANPAPGRLAEIRLTVGHLAPEFASRVRLVVRLNGEPVRETQMAPGKAFRVLSLPVPVTARNEGLIRLELEAETWKPSHFGFPNERDLGVMVGWTPLQVLSEE